MPRTVLWTFGSLDQEIRWNEIIRDMRSTTSAFKTKTETTVANGEQILMNDVWAYLTTIRALLMEIEALTEG